MSDVSERIKERRKEIGITMEELAAKAGYTSSSRKTAIFQIEAGKASIPFSRLPGFSSALRTNVYFLLGMIDNPNITDSEILANVNVSINYYPASE